MFLVKIRFIRYLWLGIIVGVFAVFPISEIIAAQFLNHSHSIQIFAQAKDTQPLVKEVATAGMTVSNMEDAIAFYTQVLSFEVINDVEVSGREYELLQGVFGYRAYGDRYF